MSKPRITKATITYARGLFDFDFGVEGSAKAALTFDDGTTGTFCWFHDEVTFRESDFVGHTMEEVRQTFMQRDMAYLRS